MSVLVSRITSKTPMREFSKDLFTEVHRNLEVVPDDYNRVYTEEYKEVKVATYIRTDTDNLVLVLDDGSISKVSDIPPISFGVYPSILIDCGLQISKDFITSSFTFKSEEALRKFGIKSTCYPVGAIMSQSECIAVFSIIISESLLREPDIILNSGLQFRPIETLHFEDELQREISKSLVLVKSEDKK